MMRSLIRALSLECILLIFFTAWLENFGGNFCAFNYIPPIQAVTKPIDCNKYNTILHCVAICLMGKKKVLLQRNQTANKGLSYT